MIQGSQMMGALPMRRRFDLTDLEWSIMQPLLPTKSRGVPRVEIPTKVQWQRCPAWPILRIVLEEMVS